MADIVLLQLGPWAEGHLQTIAKATTQSDFDEAFDSFVAKEAEITFNGAKISRDQYKTQIRGEAFDELSATVSFNGITTVPGTDNGVSSNYVGEAGIFYTTVIIEGIVIRDSHVERKITSSINISVRNDPSVPKPPATGIHGLFYDPRRAFAINQVATDAPNTPSSA